jgi:hypothetical protein
VPAACPIGAEHQGFGTMGQTQEEAEETMRKLISSEGVPDVDG